MFIWTKNMWYGLSAAKGSLGPYEALSGVVSVTPELPGPDSTEAGLTTGWGENP